MPNIITADQLDGSTYTSTNVAEDLIDPLRDAAPSDLQTLLNEGGVISGAGTAQPIIIVGTPQYNAIAAEWRAQCVSVTCLNPRLTAETIETTINGRQVKVHVYYIDGIPVIPISDINYYDRYVNTTTHFAAITVAGNINLGASFDTLGQLDNDNAGILIQRKTDLDELGKYLFLAHALFGTFIADHDFIVATTVTSADA